VVNQIVDHPAKIFRVFAGFFLFSKETAQRSVYHYIHGADAASTEIQISRKELPT